jgi:hypothetical protein
MSSRISRPMLKIPSRSVRHSAWELNTGLATRRQIKATRAALSAAAPEGAAID